MARKKKTRTKKSVRLFGIFPKKKTAARTRSKKQKKPLSAGLRVALGIMIVTLLAAGAAVGFLYLDRYVNTTVAQDVPNGSLKLIDPPAWLNQEWIDQLVETAGGKRFPLDETSATLVSERLQTLFWLKTVRVQTTPDYLEIHADYRRPVGFLDLGRSKYYLDAELVVLDYLPLDTLPVVEITGVAAPRSIPPPGNRWAAEDAAAAVRLLDWLYKTDLHFLNKQELQKPLLDEIESIDVSNFAARQSNAAPHIVLTVEDGTKINWGAAWGQAARYLEQDENDKLTDLYQFYMDHNNTLQGTAKYIELRQL